jgi:hypothetical protein
MQMCFLAANAELHAQPIDLFELKGMAPASNADKA